MSTYDQRPDPNRLLARLNAEEARQARGKLKIFLGYVAGVGKTFAMLEAAHQRVKERVDVAIGYVETHGRRETEALASGLPLVPRRVIEYHGASLPEMDLDAILLRHPQLVLVDELAHSNAPVSRHPKRCQDVEELLEAGIDVYTTLNIQHLESLNDVVAQITGVTVRETVPDRVVDVADEIELVDLPTGELIQRLQEGKVYIPEQASRAMQNFFRKGNLTALRELALRRAAERVDTQMLSYMENKAIPGPWPAGDRILVCISSHPLGERLVRAGRKLADDLNAGWLVVFVETPGHLHMPEENRLRVQRNLQLAEDLGAKVFTITSASVAETVIDFAHQHNITKIIAGKPYRPRWFELVRGTVIDQIIRGSGSIDIYVVSESETDLQRMGLRRLPFSNLSSRLAARILASLLLVLLATLAGIPLHPFLEPTNLAMLYLVAVVISAALLGRGPAIIASVAGVFAFDYFFVDPRFSFSVNDTQYILTFTGLLLVGLLISGSAALLRDQVDVLKRRERQTQALNTLSRELTAAVNLDQVLETVIRNVDLIFNRETAVLLPEDGQMAVKAASPGLILSEAEIAVADWAFKHRAPAGRGTTTLPAAGIRYLPLVTASGTVGVLGIRPLEGQKGLSNEQRLLVEGVVSLAAIAIERASFAQKAGQSELLKNTEKLQTALLNSISHELRTPLAAITGVLSSLDDSEKARPENQLDSPTRVDLLHSAVRQAERLNHLVGNLLDMTRLEANALRLNVEPVDLVDLVGTVVNRFSSPPVMHPIQLELPTGLPLAAIDAVLIGQVLENLLDNAAKFSPQGSPIRVSASVRGQEILVAVTDRGVGIPAADLGRVFDKFYRVQRQEQIAGTGLGLSICKGIIEAHGGRIWAAKPPEGGAVISFTLPVAQESQG